ncbi:MAG: helix-turn-helix transcriptional regulator [Chloroflexi bacterium]|nr:helix-turn-helix transcriptional regulator [Chloroflexota bacterium]
MRNIIGQKVREARFKHQPALTQEELATRLQRLGFDIDRVGISKIETGLRQIHDHEIVLLAQALEVSAGWLLSED